MQESKEDKKGKQETLHGLKDKYFGHPSKQDGLSKVFI